MKAVLIFLLCFLLTSVNGQNIELVYKGKFISKIPIEAEEFEEKSSVAIEVGFIWRVFIENNYFLVLIETEKLEKNTGAWISNQSDTLLFDVKKKLVYDFSTKKIYFYQAYTSANFKQENEKYVGDKSIFYVDKSLPKTSVPLPTLQNISENGIKKIEGKFLLLEYMSQKKAKIDFQKITSSCKLFEQKKEVYPLPF
jgi:hypothetical protein